MKFCPLCGKNTEDLIEGFCSKCFKEKFEPKFNEIKVKQCNNCQRIFQKNKWDKINLKNFIERQLKQTEKHSSLKEIKEKELIVNIHDILFVIPFELEKSLCNICSPSKTYFEGKLQLRSPNDKIVKYVREELKKSKEKGIFVSKEEKVKGGIDLYISDKKYIQALGRKLQEKFGGIVKAGAQLFSVSHQTGKELYRVNVMFRPADFGKGDLILVGNEKIKVTSVGKEVFGTDEKGRKVHIALEKLGNYKVL
ncbi:MAG: NMD3-related protein [Candidatus Woesearchaeota archaeon]